MFILLFSGCTDKSDVKIPESYTCRFTDGTVSGTLTLQGGTVEISDLSVNGASTELEIKMTPDGYTLKVGTLEKYFEFTDDGEAPPTVLMGKTLLDISRQIPVDCDVTAYANGNIKEIKNIYDKSYIFSDYR